MLVAIEGIDGSGKATQAALLASKAAAGGFTTVIFSFPGYDKNAFGLAVGNYLNGLYGDINRIPPQLIALLFAGDRYTARDDILESLSTRDIVICDRYVASNLAHQGAKLAPDQWPDFFAWVKEIEHGIYKMPHPDLSIYLNTPVSVARSMIAKKRDRSYTTLKEDFHEKDEAYLEKCVNAYRYLFVNDIEGPWHSIDTVTQIGNPIPAEELSVRIWELCLTMNLNVIDRLECTGEKHPSSVRT